MTNKDNTKVWNLKTYEWDPIEPKQVTGPKAWELLYQLPNDDRQYTEAELLAKGIKVDPAK